jgi:hypothetical protein
VLLPDHDGSAWKHINDVGASLVGIAARIRALTLPGLPPKGDIIDWATAGGTREALDRLIEGATDWQPMTPAADKAKAEAQAGEDALIEALLKMRPGVEFARERKKAAKELGVSQDAIEAELEARRSEKTAAPLHGHWIVEPWPEQVEGDSLLRDIVRRILRHVVCSRDDALAIALWIMLAWIHDEIATHSPILNINSAEPESGKSTTLGLVSFLAPRCVSSVEISEAALYRSIELWQPSFVIDEFDSVLASEDKTALRSVINSGHTRGQGVVRCVEPDFTPKMFKTWSAGNCRPPPWAAASSLNCAAGRSASQSSASLTRTTPSLRNCAAASLAGLPTMRMRCATPRHQCRELSTIAALITGG